MKTSLKFLTCFVIIASACAGIADKVYGSSDLPLKAAEKGVCTQLRKKSLGEKENNSLHCKRRARERALEINAAIDQTFPLLVPATAQEGAEAFASFFANHGVFQFPGGIVRGKDAIFDTFKAYADNPGEMNQHVIVRKAYWDAKNSTLSVERTWFATLTVDTNFCGKVVPAGTTYSQDDNIIIRFACDSDCDHGCVLPGKVVYYNEYFNTAQFESNFTSDYPQPCNREGKKCKGNK